jgi:hypothetical protein
MAKMSWARFRGFIAGVVALILVVILASVATAALGMDIPILSTIAETLGVEVAEGG